MACWRAKTANLNVPRQWYCYSTRHYRHPRSGAETGVQVFQFPEGVTWGDGQVAYVAIGIAASSDEHLGLLRQLTHVLSDDSVAEQLKSATTAEELRALLMGEKQSEQLKLDNEMLTLDIVASDLLTLQALNAARLKEARAVDATLVRQSHQ